MAAQLLRQRHLLAALLVWHPQDSTPPAGLLHQIDMDTIEMSNLNRQFLFRKRHVGMSKSVVAAEAAKHMRPGIDITACQARGGGQGLYPTCTCRTG